MTKLDERERTLTKRCTKCYETKPLEEFSPRRDRRGGRSSRCRVCKARYGRERRWAQRGIPESEWPRLHEEAEARAARRNSVPAGCKACSHCGEAKPLEEFPPHPDARDGRQPYCHACDAKRAREARWAKKGIPESEWQRLHREADRQQRMRELAAQHGLKYCPDCDMCLGRAFFHRNAASPDGLYVRCRACQSARKAAYLRTPAGRASSRGARQRRRAKERGLPTDGTGPREWAAHMEELDEFLCYLCGGMLTAEDEIHWDHVDPISTGTTGTVLHNMRAVHARCNLMRGNRSLDEWWAATGLLDYID